MGWREENKIKIKVGMDKAAGSMGYIVWILPDSLVTPPPPLPVKGNGQ